jgi:signal transduction histidine kinase
MISSVLQNLTTNAIKFSFPFGTIKISAREDRERIVMSISDQGIGIPKDIRNRLFRLDEYISTKGTDNETGTGLGLIYCKDLIERHNGAIWIEDDENRGTTISFSLPNT